MLKYVFLIAVHFSLTCAAFGQQSQFTYQGFLKNGASPANGVFDFRFRILDENSSPIGAEYLINDLEVNNGVFTVWLDFGYNVFSGPNRFLEISVRHGASTDPYVTVYPYFVFASTPYSIKSRSASLLNGFTSDGFIQNTNIPQQSANFNVAGNGTVGGNFLIGGIVTGSGARLTINTTANQTGAWFEAPSRGSNTSHIHYGSTGDWYIRSAAATGKVILQDMAGANVGIGTAAPGYKLEVLDSSNSGLRVQSNVAGGKVASFGANGRFEIDTGAAAGGRLTVLENGFVGIGTNVPNERLVISGGFLRLNSLGGGGTTQLCLNAAQQVSSCGSSLRYKTNVKDFSRGLDLIRRLRPASFAWKEGNGADLGLVAEDVASVEPLLTTQNARGEIEGVKYDRIGVVLVNAVKEQQAIIEKQQAQIDALVKIVCNAHPGADVCKK